MRKYVCARHESLLYKSSNLIPNASRCLVRRGMCVCMNKTDIVKNVMFSRHEFNVQTMSNNFKSYFEFTRDYWQQNGAFKSTVLPVIHTILFTVETSGSFDDEIKKKKTNASETDGTLVAGKNERITDKYCATE